MTKDKLEKFKEDNKIKPPKIGQHILRKCNYNLQLLMTDDNYEIWRYDKTKGCFMEDGEHVIRNITQNLLGDYSTDYYVNEVVKWFKNRRKKGYLICRDELDGETRYIGLDNGVYDFEAGKLKEHNSTYKLTKKLPIRYNTDAKLTTGKKFLNDLTNDQKVIDTLQEMFGYTLWRRYEFQKAFILWGTGANGRSTLLNTLTAMLGDSNVTNVSIDRISSGNRFVAIELHGKMANISLEIGKKTIQDTAVFKMATGGDMILGEKKFKDPMNFRNYAKLIFAVNKVPITQDRTTAFYRRWIPIELTNYFGDKKNDPYILDKLITQSELSAWFNWSIEGLERLLSKKRFTGSWTAQQVEDWWDNHTNHVYRFIKTRYIKEANNTVKKNKVYQEYEKFCEDNMIIPKPFNKFCGEIISVCPYPIVEIHKVTGRVWKGIRKK